ncbi:MAG TPA: peptidoglycan DD-metalloendopeptidase family protein [Actinomycetota bacterium]|nr:peptidoglycan DD-metalloendopeptidase family protein [Actinomycetota bacterium]
MTFTFRALVRTGSTPGTARKGLLVAVLILALTIQSVPAYGAATPQELAKAKEQRAAVQRQLDQTVAAYDAAQAKLAETQASMNAGQRALEQAEAEELEAQIRLSKRADVMYRRGPVAIFQYLFGAETFSDFGRRMTLVQGAAKQDSSTIAEAARTKQEISSLQEQLQAEEQRQEELLASMSSQTQSLTENFTKAQALEASLTADREAALTAEREKAAKAAAAAQAAEEAKAKAAEAAAKASPAARPSPAATRTSDPARPSPSPSPTEAAARVAQTAPVVPAGTRNLFCPVNGPVSFTDTYGAPRSGGRKHQGVDMFAPMRTPAAAIVDGTLTRREESTLGGLSVYLRGNDGTEYFYTHLAAYADVAPGQKVSAGRTIGYVGDTGNAKGGPAHLHFEIRTNGVPINPTPTARAACG